MTIRLPGCVDDRSIPDECYEVHSCSNSSGNTRSSPGCQLQWETHGQEAIYCNYCYQNCAQIRCCLEHVGQIPEIIKS